MIITDENLTYIETSLAFHGIKDLNLREDFTDHICTYIESAEGDDFELAYTQAVYNLGGYGAFQLIQNQINEKNLIKKVFLRKKIFYMLSSFNLMLLASGLLFKLNKWPYSGILLAVAFTILIFGTIPYWFYGKYKLKVQKIILLNK